MTLNSLQRSRRSTIARDRSATRSRDRAIAYGELTLVVDARGHRRAS